jgi:preprotein translocase subunit SecD
MFRKLLPPIALLSLLLASPACARLFSRQQGPQDKGGIFLVFAVKADADQLEQSITRTIHVIESRCNQLAIYCKLERQGGDHVMLRVSSDMEPARIKDVLLSEGLEMRAVVSRPSPAPPDHYATQAEAEEAAGADKVVLPYDEREKGAPVQRRKFVVLERTPIVTGEDIRDARAIPSSNPESNNYEVMFSLRPDGAVKLQSWTRVNINNYMAIILNKEVRSIAYITTEISDSGVITGRYTKEQAEDVAHVLITGNLPAPVELVREGTYKP